MKKNDLVKLYGPPLGLVNFFRHLFRPSALLALANSLSLLRALQRYWDKKSRRQNSQNLTALRLAVLGIAAGLCISAQRANPENSETAMTKCSKTPGDAEAEGNPAPSSCHSPGWENHPKNDTSQLDSDTANKGAAKKVVEGTSNTSINGKRKSAAQKVREGY